MKRWKKYSGFCYILFSVIMLLLCLLAYHDMQTAEGVGLYFALKAGNSSRLPFDIAADVVRMGSILLFLILSCVCTGHKGCGVFFRLLSVWVALMPMVSMGALVPLTEGFGGQLWTLSLKESRIVDSFWWGETEFGVLLLLWLPMLCMLAAGLVSSGQKLMLRWYKVCLAAVVLLLVMILMFPGLFAVWQFLVCYALLLCCFDMWERLQEGSVEWRKWSILLFALMWLRGVWRMLELLSVSHV